MLISAIVVIPVYYAISTLSIHNYEKRKTWKQVNGKTTLKGNEFIRRIQEICLHKNYTLLEISEKHAYIKENISFRSGGVLYYIELNASEPDSVTVYARGSIYKRQINPNCLTGMVNMLFS